jgi:ribosome-binding protein aMBF1 (putative translation factor)
MLNADSEKVLGLSNQHYWFREATQADTGHNFQTRVREEKESYKWQRNIETLTQRLPTMENIIDVSDRGADIYEYLAHQQTHQHRFVVRASDNRQL